VIETSPFGRDSMADLRAQSGAGANATQMLAVEAP